MAVKIQTQVELSSTIFMVDCTSLEMPVYRHLKHNTPRKLAENIYHRVLPHEKQTIWKDRMQYEINTKAFCSVIIFYTSKADSIF